MKLIKENVYNAICNSNSCTIEQLRDCLTVTSYEEYISCGGTKSCFDLYYKIKERAKEAEGDYISKTDFALSVPDCGVTDHDLYKMRVKAQLYWVALNTIFNVPLRKVSYLNFDYNEFKAL